MMQEEGADSQVNNKRHAYLVRCWQEADGSWRYTVDAVDGRSTPRRGFPNPNKLLAYLETILPQQIYPNFFDGGSS